MGVIESEKMDTRIKDFFFTQRYDGDKSVKLECLTNKKFLYFHVIRDLQYFTWDEFLQNLKNGIQ